MMQSLFFPVRSIINKTHEKRIYMRMKKQENIFHIVTHLQGVHVSDYSSFPIVESCFPSLHWPDLCYLKTIYAAIDYIV